MKAPRAFGKAWGRLLCTVGMLIGGADEGSWRSSEVQKGLQEGPGHPKGRLERVTDASKLES